jgi:hypothetical protein
MADGTKKPTRPLWRRVLYDLIALLLIGCVAYSYYAWPRTVFIHQYRAGLTTDITEEADAYVSQVPTYHLRLDCPLLPKILDTRGVDDVHYAIEVVFAAKMWRGIYKTVFVDERGYLLLPQPCDTCVGK